MNPLHSRRGWTLLESLICLTVLLLLVAVLLQFVLTRPHGHHRPLRDASQVRGIIQSLTTFAQNNRDRYPRPSALDTRNATVAGPAESKDTTAHIMSILIYGGYTPVEMFVSPMEVNPNIKVMETYQFDRPQSAPDPANALWDPAFSADFTSPAAAT